LPKDIGEWELFTKKSLKISPEEYKQALILFRKKKIRNDIIEILGKIQDFLGIR